MLLQISRQAMRLKGSMTIAMVTLLVLIGLSGQVLAQSPAKGIDGSWEGTLDAGGTQLRLVLKVTKSDTGGYAAELVSLDQGATIPVDLITVKTDSLRFEIKSVGAVFAGLLDKDRTELTGTFSQAGQELPLKFTRGKQAPAVPSPTEEVVVKTPAPASRWPDVGKINHPNISK